MARQKMSIDPDFMLDVQVKRLHEYKRQLLNALHVLVLYNRIMDNPNFIMEPRTFIFGAKASPGYHKAKMIIRFILAVARLIDASPRARKMLRWSPKIMTYLRRVPDARHRRKRTAPPPARKPAAR